MCSDTTEQGPPLELKGKSLPMGGVNSNKETSTHSETIEQSSLVGIKENYKVAGTSNYEFWYQMGKHLKVNAGRSRRKH